MNTKDTSQLLDVQLRVALHSYLSTLSPHTLHYSVILKQLYSIIAQHYATQQLQHVSSALARQLLPLPTGTALPLHMQPYVNSFVSDTVQSLQQLLSYLLHEQLSVQRESSSVADTVRDVTERSNGGEASNSAATLPMQLNHDSSPNSSSLPLDTVVSTVTEPVHMEFTQLQQFLQQLIQHAERPLLLQLYSYVQQQQKQSQPPSASTSPVVANREIISAPVTPTAHTLMTAVEKPSHARTLSAASLLVVPSTSLVAPTPFPAVLTPPAADTRLTSPAPVAATAASAVTAVMHAQRADELCYILSFMPFLSLFHTYSRISRGWFKLALDARVFRSYRGTLKLQLFPDAAHMQVLHNIFWKLKSVSALQFSRESTNNAVLHAFVVGDQSASAVTDNSLLMPASPAAFLPHLYTLDFSLCQQLSAAGFLQLAPFLPLLLPFS